MNSDYKIRTLADYQRSLDRFEKVNDGFILPDVHLVLRIDAHRYGGGWEHEPDESYPFAPKIVAGFLATARDLMCSGFRVKYAFVHGDEISLLFDLVENNGMRRRGKLVSLISSAGAVLFTKHTELPVVFHAKLAELPTDRHVIDYFMWQRAVALRNYYSRTLGILLTEQGYDEKDVGRKIAGLGEEEREQLLVQLGQPQDSAPKELLYGCACWWEQSEEEYEIVQCRELPDSDEAYVAFLKQRLVGDSFTPETEGISAPWRVYDPKAEVIKQSKPKPKSQNNGQKKTAPAQQKGTGTVPFRLGPRTR